MAKYLFLFGIGLCIVGLVAGLIAGSWLPLPVGILSAGVIVTIGGIGVSSRSKKSFWNSRSTQTGTNALIATLSVLVILGLINFVAVRYGIRVDLTENQLYTLAPQTQEIVENLEQPLQVFIFARTPNPTDEQLLENYRRYSDNFKFTYVDPERDLARSQEFGVGSLGEVYLEYDGKKQFVQAINEEEGLSEVRLTNAIEQVQRDRIFEVYFLQGHGEPPLEPGEGGLLQAATSLEEEGYQVEPLTLAEQSAIPGTASVVIVAGPERPLFPGEVEALESYLRSGGSLLVMIDPETNVGLDSLLADWGVELDERVVVDASGQGSVIGLGPATPLITRYGDHPITQAFGNGLSVFPLARPVEVDAPEGVEADPLVFTNEQSWAESNLASDQLTFDPQSDRSGPLTLGFALERTFSEPTAQAPKQPEPAETAGAIASTPDNTATKEQASESSPTNNGEAQKHLEDAQNPETSQSETQASRLVVFGDSTFATNGWFEQQLNRDIFLNTVEWLANPDEPPLSLRPKEQTNRRIVLEPGQAILIGWTALLILPLLSLIAAGLAWWRRR